MSAAKQNEGDIVLDIGEVNKAVTEFNVTQEGIAVLRKKYDGIVFDVTDPKEMKAAKEARQEVRQPRYEIERIRKAAKAPILALGKELDGRAKELTAAILAIEEPIDEQIKIEEARIEAEKQKAIDAEVKRVETIQSRIHDIRDGADAAVLANKSSAELEKDVALLKELSIDDSFEEFQEQAADAKETALARLNNQLIVRREHEAEEKRLAEERAELEELRKKEAARVAEDEKRRKAEQEEEDRKRRLKQEQDRKAQEAADKRRQDELDAQKQAQEEADRKRQAELDAQRKAQEEEQARIDKEKAEIQAEKDRIAQEAAEKEARAAAEKEEAERLEREAAEYARKSEYPGDEQMESAIKERFDVPSGNAIKWLKSYPQGE